MIVFDGAGFEIDIHEGVQLIQHDIYIIRTDTGGYDRQSFVAGIAGMGHEFPVLPPDLDAVKPAADLGYAIRIANGDDGVWRALQEADPGGKWPPFVDYQFGFLNCSHKKYR